MGTLSEIQHRKQINKPFIVEHIDLPEYSIEDILTTDGDFRLTEVFGVDKKVIRAFNYEKVKDRPDFVDELIKRYNMDEVTIFASMDDYTLTGLRKHVDPLHICAINIVGITEWIVEDKYHFTLNVGDVLHVPAYMKHEVNPLSNDRLSMSFYRYD